MDFCCPCRYNVPCFRVITKSKKPVRKGCTQQEASSITLWRRPTKGQERDLGCQELRRGRTSRWSPGHGKGSVRSQQVDTCHCAQCTPTSMSLRALWAVWERRAVAPLLWDAEEGRGRLFGEGVDENSLYVPHRSYWEPKTTLKYNLFSKK